MDKEKLRRVNRDLLDNSRPLAIKGAALLAPLWCGKGGTMSYDILAAFELDYDGKSDETEVAKRVARELDLGDPVEQNRHFEREALNHMPSLEWRVFWGHP